MMETIDSLPLLSFETFETKPLMVFVRPCWASPSAALKVQIGSGMGSAVEATVGCGRPAMGASGICEL